MAVKHAVRASTAVVLPVVLWDGAWPRNIVAGGVEEEKGLKLQALNFQDD